MTIHLAIHKLREAAAHARKHGHHTITLGLTHSQTIIDAADAKARAQINETTKETGR